MLPRAFVSCLTRAAVPASSAKPAATVLIFQVSEKLT
jgi:hypothetical protein